MTRFEHAGAAAESALASSIDAVATSIAITTSAGWPDGSVGPFWTTIDAGNSSEEKVLVTSRTGTTLTVSARGADGTTAVAHGASAPIIHSFSATEADDANEHIEDSAGVHGIAGAVVGTTDTQTLTNKTLTSPAITGSSGSVVTTAATQTLTNKTLTSPTVAGGTLSGTFSGTSNLPLGVLGYASRTTAQTGLGTSATDLTSLSAAVTAGSSRRVRITGQVQVNHDNSNTFTLQIREGATVLQSVQVTQTAGLYSPLHIEVVVAPSSGAHTYKLTAITDLGTAGMVASATQPAFILVEDIGAA